MERGRLWFELTKKRPERDSRGRGRAVNLGGGLRQTRPGAWAVDRERF